jgi:hypothetical protein
MSKLVQYLKENGITKYKIFHKRITNNDVINGKLCLELFDKISTLTQKRAIYFILDNINFNENDHGMMTHGTTTIVEMRDMKYFRYLQPFEHMKTTPDDAIYMYSFCLYPTELLDSGSIELPSLIFSLEKNNNEDFNINERSSVTYAVQYV